MHKIEHHVFRLRIMISTSFFKHHVWISEVSISADPSSIKEGTSGVVSCVVEASDVGNDILWYKGDSTTPLSTGNDYTIQTTKATAVESDGKTKKSTSDLSVLNFASDDVASYSCKVDYADPILDETSAAQALAILGNLFCGLSLIYLCVIDKSPICCNL